MQVKFCLLSRSWNLYLVLFSSFLHSTTWSQLLWFRTQLEIWADSYTEFGDSLLWLSPFCGLPLLPSIYGCLQPCSLILLTRNSVDFYSNFMCHVQWVHPSLLPGVKSSLLLPAFLHFPVPSDFFVFCLNFVVVICRSVGLA